MTGGGAADSCGERLRILEEENKRLMEQLAVLARSCEAIEELRRLHEEAKRLEEENKRLRAMLTRCLEE